MADVRATVGARVEGPLCAAIGESGRDTILNLRGRLRAIEWRDAESCEFTNRRRREEIGADILADSTEVCCMCPLVVLHRVCASLRGKQPLICLAILEGFGLPCAPHWLRDL